MKKNSLLLCLLMLVSSLLQAQVKDYKVVFDLTSKDTATHRTVLRWINGISQATPDAQLEVVFYGQSLGMVTKGKSAAEEDVKKILANKNVSFKVCAIAMQRHNIEKNDLIDGVEIVPDGIYEIVMLQGQGWGYIKVGQ